jgi:hypothetical protein
MNTPLPPHNERSCGACERNILRQRSQIISALKRLHGMPVSLLWSCSWSPRHASRPLSLCIATVYWVDVSFVNGSRCLPPARETRDERAVAAQISLAFDSRPCFRPRFRSVSGPFQVRFRSVSGRSPVRLRRVVRSETCNPPLLGRYPSRRKGEACDRQQCESGL